jgi:small subunit ribosomal protein S9
MKNVKDKEITSDKRKYFQGIGRRKTATAKSRIYLKGKGNFTINKLELKKYFPILSDREIVQAALKETGNLTKFDITTLVSGGGRKAQAEAIRHSLARALTYYEKTLRTILKPKGYLKRDPRKKERKKPGLKKARRAPQFSKR